MARHRPSNRRYHRLSYLVALATVAGSLLAQTSPAAAGAAPTLFTNISAPVALGGAIHDTATLMGGVTPTGFITFTAFGPNDDICAGTPVFTDTVTVSGNGLYDSASFIPSVAGVYRFVASYSGDANNSPAGPTVCADPFEVVSVDSLTTAATPSITLGEAAEDVATLSGVRNPTNSMTFDVYGPNDPTCANPVWFNSIRPVTGTGPTTSVTSNFVPPAVGTYRVRVTYSGDTDNAAVGPTACNDPAEMITVNPVGPPTVSVSSVSQAEGSGGGFTPFAFTISLSSASATPVTVQYYTADITAHAPADYTRIPPTVVTFAPGETTKVVNVNVVADNIAESDQRFSVKLTHPVGATLGTATGVGTIIDDDGPLPTLSINDVSQAEGSGGGTTRFVFTVSLSAPSATTVTVSYYTVGVEATSGGDFVPVLPPVTLTFAPGETTKQVAVMVIADNTVEPNERFFVRLNPPTNATRAKAVGVGTILNDD